MNSPLDAFVDLMSSSLKAYRYRFVVVQTGSFIGGIIQALKIDINCIPPALWSQNLDDFADSKCETPPPHIEGLSQLLSMQSCSEVLLLRAHALIFENCLEAAKIIVSLIHQVQPNNERAFQVLSSLNKFTSAQFEVLQKDSDLSIKGFGSLSIWQLKNATACDRRGPIIMNDGRFARDQSPIDFNCSLQEVSVRQSVKIDSLDNIIPLTSSSANNFWHWCIEQLPRAYTATEAQIKGKFLVPSKSEFVVHTLSALGIDPNDIIETRHEIDIFAENLFFIEHPDLSEKHKNTYSSIRDKVVAYCKEKSTSNLKLPKRIYVSRKSGRTVINEQKILPLLSEFGFLTVCFDEIPFVDQVCMVNNAEVFMGPHGASFANNLFMPNNSMVIELFSPNYVNPCMSHIHKFFNHHYSMIVAKNRARNYPHGDDIEVPIDILELTLKNLAE